MPSFAGSARNGNRFAFIKKEAGFRSGLEKKNADFLSREGVGFEYEKHRVYYTVPSRLATYQPDFVLENGIIVETKGIWETADRQKHALLRAQYPDLDIRIVFSNSASTIGKKSNTTYAMYCQRLGIEYADKLIPFAWFTSDKATILKRFRALKDATCQPSS